MGTFSLPTQRCFWDEHRAGRRHVLFSAYAEVFLGLLLRGRTPGTFLCLRRGVSYAEEGATLEWVFSLPTQRCFRYEGETRPAPDLFSAYAEVFPSRTARAKRSRSFLCLRRGVSLIVLLHASAVIFSLPTQWCFWVDRFDLRFTVLFSAYAEVFPTLRFFSTAVPAFLCLRRGVSTLHIVNHYTNSFSLPTQRCFH